MSKAPPVKTTAKELELRRINAELSSGRTELLISELVKGMTRKEEAVVILKKVRRDLRAFRKQDSPFEIRPETKRELLRFLKELDRNELESRD